MENDLEVKAEELKEPEVGIIGSNPDETTTPAPTMTTTAPAPAELEPQRVPTELFVPPGSTNAPRCQCFCQPTPTPPAPAPVQNNFAFQPVPQTVQPPSTSTSPRFLTNPFSQVPGPLFVNKNSNRRDSIRLAFNVNTQPQAPELFVKPSENTQRNQNPLFLRRSDRRNAIRMAVNVNNQKLFVKPSEEGSETRNPLDL